MNLKVLKTSYLFLPQNSTVFLILSCLEIEDHKTALKYLEIFKTISRKACYNSFQNKNYESRQ